MIEIINRRKKDKFDPSRFEKLLKKLIRHYDLKRPELSLVFVGDAEIRRLNRKFRKKDKATDVLSFPLRERAADGKFYLGDIIIALPTARRQAAEIGHPLERELEYLTIHGFLHLLGYEHDEGHEEEETKMRERYASGKALAAVRGGASGATRRPGRRPAGKTSAR
jgi:probable rRNA maturation factor